jgi:phosphoribosylformimino-5-aminoimidazole carboxamide ribotide isomerase
MKIIPAIDILDGKCVRLLRGNFDDVTIYSNSPLEQVRKFKDAGFSYIHIVDLDAALSGKNKNLSLIKSIANIESIKIQVGGGIRSIETINNLFEIGVDRLIVGTAAIKNSHFLNQIKEQNISDRIVFGLDFVNIKNEPMLFVNGWTENTRINIFDYLRTNNWIKNILVTDISKDGTLEGPNLNIYKKLLLDKSLNLIASGGIGGINDISNLIEIGSHECVIGKAIYENKVTLNELINAN